MTVAVANLVKRFGAVAALNGVSLEGEPGEFLALLGPSGSGKTTLLRIMAGLEFPDSGEVYLEGENAAAMTPRDRRIGMVFQHYALFRHMTVADNVAFGLSVRPSRTRPPRAEIERRVGELLDLVQLGGLQKRFPSQLSGGQRQRVALARALAVEPRLLLLDEPFGALDAKVRKELRRWLREVHDATHLTTVFVTHDQDEALDLADRVVVMNHGRIEQVDRPEALWDRPASAFVCDFLGGANRLPCRLRGGEVDVAGVRLANSAAARDDGEGVGFVRPHEFAIARPGEPGLAVTLRRLLRTGARASLECAQADGSLVEATADAPPDWLRPGEAMVLAPTVVRAFPAA
jgi:sulfate transport system ATP-binding protein